MDRCVGGINWTSASSNMGYHPGSLLRDWINMKLIGIGLASLALVGCTQTVPGPEVTVTAPAPTVTVQQQNPYQQAMAEAWSQMSYQEQQAICYGFSVDPDVTFGAFDEGAQGAIPKSEFMLFFSQECSSY